MSRVECDHCGARYELQGDASVAAQVAPGPTATCRECGAPARMTSESGSQTPTPLGAIRETTASRDADDDTAEPPTARSPATLLEDMLEDEKTIALTTSSAAAAAEAGRAADAAAGLNGVQDAPLADSVEDEVPISATPSMEALISRVRTDRSPRAEAGKPGSFLDSPEYDLRPPDIQVEPGPAIDRMTPSGATRTVRTDAPVAGTHRPPPSAGKSSGRSGLVVALLLGAGALIFAARGLKSSDEPAATPVAPPTLEEATLATGSLNPSDPSSAAESTASTNAATIDADAVTTAEAPKASAPAAPEVAEQKAPSSTARAAKSGGAVVPASLTGRDEPGDKNDVAEKVDPAPAEAAFDANAASAALDASAASASSCRKEGDPSGVATVTITFSPSGRVTTATISGPPFAGTETGSCIASRLRSTRVPAFAGDFITVKKTVTIQ